MANGVKNLLEETVAKQGETLAGHGHILIRGAMLMALTMRMATKHMTTTAAATNTMTITTTTIAMIATTTTMTMNRVVRPLLVQPLVCPSPGDIDMNPGAIGMKVIIRNVFKARRGSTSCKLGINFAVPPGFAISRQVVARASRRCFRFDRHMWGMYLEQRPG